MAEGNAVKILFALPGFHRFDRGAEVALLSVADAMAQAGEAVTVMGSGAARPGTAYRFVAVPSIARTRFERFPFFPPLRSETAWEDATFAAALLRRYDPSAYDAVVTCSFPFTHWALRRPARRKPLQVFVTQNGDWPATSDRSEYRSFRTDLLVCTNPDYYAASEARWPCALVPNGVDLARFSPGPGERAALGLPAEGPIVLMVSALIATKRVMDGIRAVAALPGVHLVVAGDGPLRAEAQALADSLMPGRFRRVSLAAAQMPALYRSADAFLHLSLLESFGNVFIEAWASGLPVVGHDTPRLRWILGDNTRFLCDTEDQAALGNALKAALAQGAGEPAPGIERFAWPTIAAQYREAIAARLAARVSP